MKTLTFNWTKRNTVDVVIGDPAENCGFVAWFDKAHGLVISSWKAATIAKSSAGFTISPIVESGYQGPAVTAKNQKAAVELYVAAYAEGFLLKPVESKPYTVGDIVPRPCPTCGSPACASRFDCQPGAPHAVGG